MNFRWKEPAQNLHARDRGRVSLPLLLAEDFGKIVRVARAQVQDVAQVLDLCTAITERTVEKICK